MGKMAAITQENCVSAGGVGIANHCVIANSLRIVNLPRRSSFSTAGCFGTAELLPPCNQIDVGVGGRIRECFGGPARDR